MHGFFSAFFPPFSPDAAIWFIHRYVSMSVDAGGTTLLTVALVLSLCSRVQGKLYFRPPRDARFAGIASFSDYPTTGVLTPVRYHCLFPLACSPADVNCLSPLWQQIHGFFTVRAFVRRVFSPSFFVLSFVPRFYCATFPLPAIRSISPARCLSMRASRLFLLSIPLR